jgi:hypothetical protein
MAKLFVGYLNAAKDLIDAYGYFSKINWNLYIPLMATGWTAKGVGVRVPVGAGFFSSPRPDRLWGPPSLLSNGYWVALSPGREADHLPSIAVVKKTWIYTSTPPYVYLD